MTRFALTLLAAVYLWAVPSASPAAAAPRDLAALAEMRAGDMRKLVFASAPKPVPEVAFLAEDGSEMTLAALRGKVVLVNFWATWCAPCREEMPALERLQAELGGERFQVATIATGRNPPPAIRAFFEKVGVTRLPKWRDPRQALARAFAVFGLPTSVLIDEEGREIARLLGDAEWDSPEAVALIRAVIEAGPGGEGL